MLKKITDIILSLVIIIAASPLIVIILFVAYDMTEQFPLIVQNRFITLEKKKVKLYKIRTIKSSINFSRQESNSNNIYYKNDFAEHVPRFCRWLRRTGLDEILQLINVIKGEMSLVGPRPLLEKDLLIMKKCEPEFYYRRTKLKSPPGITGYWQVYGDRSKGTENLIELEENYEKQKSFHLDLKIILKSILIVLTASHSDSIIISNRNLHLLKNKIKLSNQLEKV